MKIYIGSIVKFYGDVIIVSVDEYIIGMGVLGDVVKVVGGLRYEREFGNMK